MHIVKSPSRALFLAGLAAFFLGTAVSRPEAQPGQPVQGRVYGYHGGSQSLVTRVHEVTDLFAGAGGTGSPLYRVSPYPTIVNPSFLVGFAPGGNGVRRINTNGAVPISNAPTLGTTQAGTYCNASPLKPHYFTAGNFATSVNSTVIEFYDANLHSVVEAFLPAGLLKSAGRGAAFCKTTAGAGNPYYRWFWTDLAPTGSILDTIFAIDLRGSDVWQTGPSGDPWNPTGNSIVYGPPFPALATQMNTPTWTEQPSGRPKFVTAGPLSANDDGEHRLAIWTDTAGLAGVAGRNYLISGQRHLESLIPPFWAAHFHCHNADSPTFPLPRTVIGSWDDGGYTTPEVFWGMAVIGNYLVASSSKNGTNGNGGTQYSFWWIPTLVTGPAGPPADPSLPARRGTFTWLGATGIGSNFNNTKVYFGSDNSIDEYGVAAVAAAATNMTTSANPPILSIAPHRCLTPLEENLPSPPDRTHPGNDWVSYQINLNPVENFPGTGTGVGRRSAAGACSGSVHETHGHVTAAVMLVALLALATATVREAARS